MQKKNEKLVKIPKKKKNNAKINGHIFLLLTHFDPMYDPLLFDRPNFYGSV